MSISPRSAYSLQPARVRGLKVVDLDHNVVGLYVATRACTRLEGSGGLSVRLSERCCNPRVYAA